VPTKRKSEDTVSPEIAAAFRDLVFSKAVKAGRVVASEKSDFDRLFAQDPCALLDVVGSGELLAAARVEADTRSTVSPPAPRQPAPQQPPAPEDDDPGLADFMAAYRTRMLGHDPMPDPEHDAYLARHFPSAARRLSGDTGVKRTYGQ
jgi:hypothetical protein